jgi:NO-binding membrane sensor protein with MHYT domain
MHFIGMTAYHLGDMEVSYNVPLTALSLVIAIAASALGIGIVGINPRSYVRIAFGGTTAGLGIAAMHYTGMAAMQTGSVVTYDLKRVALSVGIAVGAALAALVIAFRVRKRLHMVFASAIMTGAVCGMHYTAMTAVRVKYTDNAAPMAGADPIVMGLVVVIVWFLVLASVIILAVDALSEDSTFSLAKPPPRPDRAAGADPEVASVLPRGRAPRYADSGTTPLTHGHMAYQRGDRPDSGGSFTTAPRHRT